ncbi:MAG: RraA family protein [Novosphingobium sp.]
MFQRNVDDVATGVDLSALSVAILSDARRGRDVIAPGLVRYAGSGTAAGRAVTADCEEGSLQAVFAALEHALPGDFLCIKGPGDTAYLGDLLAANLVRRNLRGAIVDGLIRDRDRVALMPLTIMARGLTPVNYRAKGNGRSMVPIVIGGVDVAPGDWIIADSDGVIVIPPAEAAQAISAAAENARVEARIADLMSQGVPVSEAVARALREAAES